MRFRLVALLALVLGGCGLGLSDESLEGAPYATVRARIDPAVVAGMEPPLLIGIGWVKTATRQTRGPCGRYGEFPEVAARCADVLTAYVDAEISMQPLVMDADGVATLTLDALPQAALSSGDALGRVAYGTILVARDADKDGRFSPWAYSSEDFDTLLGASFLSLMREGERLVLREGAWNPLSFFFPLVGCDEPPPLGLSRAKAVIDLGGAQPTGRCEITGLDVPIAVNPVSESEAARLFCEPFLDELSPEGFVPDPTSPGTCLSEDVFLVETSATCGGAFIVSLAGCYGNQPEACERFDWDFRNAPPAWWPCR